MSVYGDPFPGAEGQTGTGSLPSGVTSSPSPFIQLSEYSCRQPELMQWDV